MPATQPESPSKRQRVGSAPLLRHFSVVRQHLFQFLDRRDLVILFSSCRALRHDRETVKFALTKDATARHLGRLCHYDWTAYPPKFLPFEKCEETHGGDEADDDGDDDGDDERGDSAEEDHAMPAPAGLDLSADRQVALLSLIGLVEKNLGKVLRQSVDACATTRHPVPFAFPTALSAKSSSEEAIAELEKIGNGLGTSMSGKQILSDIGLHHENMRVSDSGVQCGFCSEYNQAVETFKEVVGADSQHHSDDKYFDLDVLNQVDDSEVCAAHLFKCGKLSHLEMVGRGDDESDGGDDKTEEAVVAAASSDFIECLCPQVLRPIREFFHSRDFTHVVRAKLPRFRCGEGFSRDDVSSVELFGGVSPGGLFAGVLVVQIFT